VQDVVGEAMKAVMHWQPGSPFLMLGKSLRRVSLLRESERLDALKAPKTCSSEAVVWLGIVQELSTGRNYPQRKNSISL